MIRAVGTAGALAAFAGSAPPPELTGLSGWVVDVVASMGPVVARKRLRVRVSQH